MKKWIALIALGTSMLVVLGAEADAAEASERFCGAAPDGFPGIAAKGPTTCAFARNVQRAVERRHLPSVEVRHNVWAPPATTVRAWSPATHRLYAIHCRFYMPYGGGWHYGCKGGNGAHVKLVS